MKKLLFLMTFLLVSTSIFAIEVENEKLYEYDISNCSVKSIKLAKMWLSENSDNYGFNNYSNDKQMYDEDLNIMIIQGNAQVFVMPLYFTLKIQVKGDILKITFNNFSAGTSKMKINSRTTGLSTLYETCDEIAESVSKYYLEY